MKIEIKYSGKIINLPFSVAQASLDASKEDLCVIINLFTYPDYLSSFDKFINDFSEKIGIGVDKIIKSLRYWEKQGVIFIDGEIPQYEEISSASASVPTYTGAQIAKFVEKNDDIGSLFYTCQAILGKDFNSHDHNNEILLKSYYKFSNEYIMLLLAHCKELDKANWAYIRKTAKALYDEGIDTYKSLEAHFSDRKNKSTLEYKIRNLFGIGTREFSKSEKEKIDKWTSANISIDFIKKAYDITVDKTGKISVAYCAKIIENWLSCGIKTVEDVENSEKERISKAQASSFETNDFFEAALRRSYNKKEEN